MPKRLDVREHIAALKEAHILAYEQKQQLINQGLDYIKGEMDDIWDWVCGMDEYELDQLSPQADAPELETFIHQPVRLNLMEKQLIVFTELMVEEHNDIKNSVVNKEDALFASGQLELIRRTVEDIRENIGSRIIQKLKIHRAMPVNFGIDKNWRVFMDLAPDYEDKDRPN